MENKEILKLVTKCIAFSLKHSDDRFCIDVEFINGNIWLRLDDDDEPVSIDGLDVVSITIIFLGSKNTLFGRVYDDPREAVERWLAECKNYILSHKGDSNE